MRTDIYSVGIILYEMLTGKRPPDAEEPGPIDATGLPPALAKIVARCTATERSDRYPDCEPLYRALLAAGPQETRPAPLRHRLGAGVTDWTLALTATMFAAGPVYTTHDRLHLPGSVLSEGGRALGVHIVVLAVLALIEAYSGATPGKWLFGLRLRRPDGSVATPLRLLRRATAFHVLLFGLSLVLTMNLFLSSGFMGRGEMSPDTLTYILLAPAPVHIGIQLALLAVLFVPRVRRETSRALHDTISDTDVLLTRPKGRLVPPAIEIGMTPRMGSTGQADWGPYRPTELFWQRAAESLWEGYDTALHRRVWIHHRPPDSPPVSPSRRHLTRPGRLRWLAGGRRPDTRWDAYEAADGYLLEPRLLSRLPWRTVCRHAIEIAREFETDEDDLPSCLDSRRVWLAGGGRTLLLDFPGPCGPAPSAEPDLHGPSKPRTEAMQSLVDEVLEAGLPARHDAINPSIAGLVHDLRRMDCTDPAGLLRRLESASDTVPFLDSTRRLGAQLALPCMVFLLGWIFYAIMAIDQIFDGRRMDAKSPGASELIAIDTALRRCTPVVSAENHPAIREKLALAEQDLRRRLSFVAGQVPKISFPDSKWSRRAEMVREEATRPPRDASSLLEPSASAELLERTQRLVDYGAFRTGLARSLGPLFSDLVLGAAVNVVLLVSLGLLPLELAWILVRGSSMLLGMFDLAAVDGAGRRAGRARLFVRAILGAIPRLAVPALLLAELDVPVLETYAPGSDLLGPFVRLPLVLLVTLAALSRSASRVADRLSGTSLRPR
ncbi:MAG: RDD family protein [Verrucomicrobiales bacterium]|nr:RDD family protein [Verrucomicrobiales bacterium]